MDNIGEFKGKVTQKTFGKGSKSEHQAVVLETDGGDLVLRRPGQNPFQDAELEQLVGMSISARGQKIGNLLYVLQWTGIGHENSS